MGLYKYKHPFTYKAFFTIKSKTQPSSRHYSVSLIQSTSFSGEILLGVSITALRHGFPHKQRNAYLLPNSSYCPNFKLNSQ